MIMKELTIQQEDINQVDWIDDLMENQAEFFKRNKTDFEWMRERREKITFKKMFERRENHTVNTWEKMFTLYNRDKIKYSNLTEDIIDEQIEFWFLNK